ncbi:Muramoyltetrapeptide carboxypeptidase [Paramagnetospirillum magnetotacticum MS-1]|uniref:Muramoyltetrapeptide carboxypeptidase n=1 Tax=Paramagnetospirillum magnetotacticum MS-1 TaxID=272627 RepID=A0A0C2YSI0_PARME|nr:LD-carboxypeptidase [Paramagnetospirillum magnetotacticum]KIL97670.1 Muramoyltetrapeptide carboxypeptidase [Paramagnetospirillum magnetotacticum MS-1]
MAVGKTRIGIVAPGTAIDRDISGRVAALAERLYPDGRVDLIFHPQCFETWGHFAGNDEARTGALVQYANDDSLDAVWFARGGYGACRLIEGLLPSLSEAARRKVYMGYSDAGSLLGALYGRGFHHLAHGPMPVDIIRPGGEAAVARALSFLVERKIEALEPSLSAEVPAAAFNLTILCHLLGTPWQPDLSDHVLMVEEVSEYMYRIDRDLFQLTSNPALRRVVGLKLGRCSDIPPNQPDFGQSEEQVARAWCKRSGIAYLGRADIGHDVGNKVVPFGLWRV